MRLKSNGLEPTAYGFRYAELDNREDDEEEEAVDDAEDEDEDNDWDR